MTVTVILYIHFEVSIVFLDKYFINIRDDEKQQVKILQVEDVTEFSTDKHLKICLYIKKNIKIKVDSVKEKDCWVAILRSVTSNGKYKTQLHLIL